MKYEEKMLDSHLLYEGHILKLRKDSVLLPNAHKSTREVVEHPGGVCVAAVTDDGEVLLVRQFRYPFGEELLELPAGKLEYGEDPLECGKRELREEAGACATEYTFLGKFYPTCGYSNEIIYLYLAKGLTLGAQHPDEDEFLDVVRLPLEQAVSMVLKNELPDGKTQAALLKAFLLEKQEHRQH
ncbi:MAG: NUDIX hydrolase [Ethanoligenens sp.]